MSFRDKLDFERLAKGALLLGAIALAWKFEKPGPAAAPASEPVASDWAFDGSSARLASPWRMSWSWWRSALLDTYDATSEDRLLAVAAGVVFYALLAMVPAITALVSCYGLFASAAAVQDDLSLLSNVLPAGGIELIQEQIIRIAARPSGLGFGFIFGLLVALWSANAGVKAMIDALNAIEGQPERRGLLGLNALSLAMTLGAIGFLLLALGAVVAFPLAMSTFGFKAYTATTTWMVRWPLQFVTAVAALAVLYRFGPSRTGPRRRWLTPGTVAAALLWLAGSAALSLYLSKFADYNATYGSLGAAIGLMMWMWLSAISVLLGAQLDVVIERKLVQPYSIRDAAIQ
jgi:membrane protein